MIRSQRKNLDKRSIRRFVKQYLYALTNYREQDDPFSILVSKAYRGLVDFNPEYDVSYAKVSEVLRQEMIADGWTIR